MRQFSLKLAIVLMLAVSPLAAFASGTVSGRVTDLFTGESIPNAKVIIEHTQLVTFADKTGAFTITGAPAGQVRVSCGAMSYNKQTKTVSVPEGGSVVVNFVLEIGSVIESEEVVVHEKKPVVDQSPQTSADTFKVEEIQDNAGAFEDVAKVMKTLPGVVQNSQFTADMYVRGAQNYENLILIDNLLLMNPYHFGVGLSLINTDLVEEITFYRGGFPAKYPLATGSVLDVTYKDGNRERVDGMVSVSLLSANGYVSGPMTDKITWTLSARRSYYDWLIDALDYEDVPVPIFSDFLLRATYEPGSHNKFILFALRSEDAVRLEIDEETPFTVDEGKVAYSNLTQVYGLNWQLFPTNWFISTTTINHQIMNLEANLTADAPLFAQTQLNTTMFHNQEEFQLHPRNLLLVGGDMAYMTIDLDAQIRLTEFTPGANTGLEPEFFDIEFDHDAPIMVYGGFLQDEWEIVKNKLRSNVGARFDYYKSDGQGWMISPRAAMAWSIRPTSVLKASWGIYYFPPFNILATDEKWGNPDLLPHRATHHVLGFEQGVTEHGMLRLETFYIEFQDLQFQNYDSPETSLENLVDLANGTPPVGDVEWKNSGYGKAYGIEIFAQKKLSGKWDGWLAYTLSEVLYNDGMGINGWFHPFQDQRHTLNIVANYRPWDNWTFSGSFGLYSGKPNTPVTDWNKQFGGSFFQYWEPQQGDLNSDRMPLYHKLDVRAERMWKISKQVDLTAFFEVYNVYNQHNVYSYWYAQEEGIDHPVRKTIYDLPILPYFGVKVNF